MKIARYCVMFGLEPEMKQKKIPVPFKRRWDFFRHDYLSPITFALLGVLTLLFWISAYMPERLNSSEANGVVIQKQLPQYEPCMLSSNK